MSNQSLDTVPPCCVDCPLKGGICDPNKDGSICTIWLRHREGDGSINREKLSGETRWEDSDTEFTIELGRTVEERVLGWIKGRCGAGRALFENLVDKVFSLDAPYVIGLVPENLDNGLDCIATSYWFEKINQRYEETGDLRASICAIKDELEDRFQKCLTEEATERWINHGYEHIEPEPEVIKYREVVGDIYRWVFSSLISKLKLFIAQLDRDVPEITLL